MRIVKPVPSAVFVSMSLVYIGKGYSTLTIGMEKVSWSCCNTLLEQIIQRIKSNCRFLIKHKIKILDLRTQKVTTLDLVTDVIGELCEPAEVLELNKYFYIVAFTNITNVKSRHGISWSRNIYCLSNYCVMGSA